jgi:hypothetical protein
MDLVQSKLPFEMNYNNAFISKEYKFLPSCKGSFKKKIVLVENT